MDFEWYYPKTELLQVSISNTAITFYNKTVQEMGFPKYVLLGYNEDNKVIGVKACNKDNENCIEFSVKQKNSYIRIYNKKFIWFVESHLDDTFRVKGKQRRYSAKWDCEQGILYIFLERPLS